MRSKLFVFGVTFAIGCGGGGGKKAIVVDAMIDSPTIDAPAACAVMASLGNLNLGNAMAMPPMAVTSDWIDTDRMGSLTGRTVLSIGGRLPSSTASLLDVLIVDYVKPQAGNFLTNTPVNFDPDPAAAPPVAFSYVFGDFDTAAMTIQNFYYASTGSITLTAVGEADGSTISGSVAATNYREIDDMNVDVPAGCTTSLGGLGFYLTQMTMAFDNKQNPGLEGLQPLTAEEWQAARQIISQRMKQ